MTMAKQQPLTAKQQEILQAAEAVKELATTIIEGLTEALGVEEEAAPAKASTKAPAKGKAKPAPEPEPEEEPEEEEGEEEEFEASEERLAAEEAVLEAVTSQVEAGELTLKDMRTYLAGLYEGNAECAACAKGKGACAKEKVIECYAMALQNFIDDDGEEHEEQDCYIRNGQFHCCGLPCEADPDDEGNVICSACGETYGVE